MVALGVIGILTLVATTISGCDSAPVSHGSGGQSGTGVGGWVGGAGGGGQAGVGGAAAGSGGGAGGGGGAAGSGGGAGGRSPGSGGAGGSSDCPRDPYPAGKLCTPPGDGSCWHDPLTYTCDRASGLWVCPLGSAPAPPHSCGGASGTTGGGGRGGGAGGGPAGAGGSAPAMVWSSDATKAVVEDAGGGFVGPPPAGSECGYGVGSYTFTVDDGKLAWHSCDTSQASAGTPFTYVDGSRVLNAGERMMLVDALEAVVISTRKLCGADKSVRLLTVTRPSGPVTYKDSFYSCNDQGLYVDNIDPVFTVASQLAK